MIIIDNQKILLVRRPNDAKVFPNSWTFPWGKLENWETLLKCAKRECFEEALAKPENLIKHSFYEYEGDTFITISHLFTWVIKEKIKKTDSVSWFTLEDIKNLEIAFDYKNLIINELQKV